MYPTLDRGEEMIKTLILYYFNQKPTHGYEIQKFIQINHMDTWTKIQSGSIYYAIGKLEKNGFIKLIEEIGSGSKARKIYDITEKGKEELKILVKKELSKEIYQTGSDKFIVFPLLYSLDKGEIIDVTNKHVVKLKNKLKNIEMWQSIKVDDNCSKVERLSFEMMISSLKYQICWHEALIEDIDKSIDSSKEIAEIISKYDFSSSDIPAMSSSKAIEEIKAKLY